MTVPPSVPSYDVADPVSAAPPRLTATRGAAAGETATDWLERNGRTLGAAAIATAVVVAGGFAWRASSRSTAERADRALYEAEARFSQGDPSAGAALQQVTSRYGDTPAGAHARVLLAQTYYDRGQYADGLRVLSGGSAPAEWRDATERLRAAGQEGSGQPKAAAGTYEQLARDAGPEAKAELLGDAARAYEEAGDKANARRVWQQVIDTGTRGASDEARIRLGELAAGGS
ncbi:MAG TPA: tetratricopeptide repeat protein [Gemmatirosa sp.]